MVGGLSRWRREHGRERINQGVSGYYLCLEIRQTYDGMLVAIPATHWKVYGEMNFVIATRERHGAIPGALCRISGQQKRVETDENGGMS